MADSEELADMEEEWMDEDSSLPSGRELVLKPVGAALGLLSLLSCAVMATVMLRTSLRRAPWTPYLLLWAAAEAVLMLIAVVEGAFVKVLWGESASTKGCVVYFFLHHGCTFLAASSAMALSADLLLRALRPSLLGPRWPPRVALALVVVALFIYSPTLFIFDGHYHNRDGHICLVIYSTSSADTRKMAEVYFYAWLYLVALPRPHVVCVGLAALCWKRQHFSEHLRFLATFLLSFLLVDLPTAVFDFLVFLSFHDLIWGSYHHFMVLHLVARLCFHIKALVMLLCLCSSADFRRAIKESFCPSYHRIGRNNTGCMTEMREVERDNYGLLTEHRTSI